MARKKAPAKKKSPGKKKAPAKKKKAPAKKKAAARRAAAKRAKASKPKAASKGPISKKLTKSGILNELASGTGLSRKQVGSVAPTTPGKRGQAPAEPGRRLCDRLFGKRSA